MWWITVVWAVECSAKTDAAALEAGLERAERALGELDEQGMQQEVVTLSAEVLPCLGQPLVEPVAARFHRLMAIHLFSLGQEEGALQTITAAKALDPAYVWNDAMLPASHPLRVAWDAADAPKTHKVPEPREGFLVFDGISGRARPKGVPTISQRLDASGSPTWTTYLGPREPLPAYREIPRRRNALLGCAIGGGAVGLGTWVASNVSKGDLKRSARDQSVSADVLDGKRSRSNVLQATSWVGFGIGIGCGVGAVIESL